MSSSTDVGATADRLIVGRIGRPHGLDGGVTVLSDSDDPNRFLVGSRFLTDTGVDLVITAVKRYRDKGLVVGFEGIQTRRHAETLRGLLLTVSATERRDLNADEFWPDQLVGLVAVSPDGSTLGLVDRVELGPGQDRLVVMTPASLEVLVPFVAAIVGDPVDGQIVIDAPDGLF